MSLREKIEALLALCTDDCRLNSSHIISRGYEHLANLCEEMPRGYCLGMMTIPWADRLAGLSNAAPCLLRALLAAIELEAAREAHWCTSEDGSTRRLADAINGFQAALAAAEKAMGGAE